VFQAGASHRLREAGRRPAGRPVLPAIATLWDTAITNGFYVALN